MNTYLEALRRIRDEGELREDRTGTGTLSLFGLQMEFDLADGFPIVTTKKLYMHGIKTELCWFLRGDTHVEYLQDRNVHIWDAWAGATECGRFGREEGDLGPIYGHQWRNFGASFDEEKGVYRQDGVDQIKRALDLLRNNPSSRRILVTGWNPKEADQVSLPPCHTLFQLYVHVDGRLSCQLYQRSADFFLGVPFNICSYSLLVHMLCAMTGLKPGRFVHTFGDAHIYTNHLEQVKEQLSREPLPLPQLEITRVPDLIEEWRPRDIRLKGYEFYSAIKAPVAV